MNAPKPSKSLEGQLCPTCHEGHFRPVQIAHVEEVAESDPITIAGIWVDRCDHCEEVVFPAETVRFIESVVADRTELLTPQELQRIREDLGVETQDQMSEMLGLGLKTFHKWESGRQFATRSMCYYIRVLAEVPGAFDFLRQRAWRAKNRVASAPAQSDLAAMFPDLMVSPATASRIANPRPHAARLNPALGLTRVVFSLK